MKLIFKQRFSLFKQSFFSWFDSYNIYNEAGQTVYTVIGQLVWGRCLKIYDHRDAEIGMVKQRFLTWPAKFEMYIGDRYIGCISKKFTFFRPKFHIDCNGWQVDGDWFEWDYKILSSSGSPVATVSKELLNWTDTYVINIRDPQDALCALMLVLAIDAEKGSKRN